MIDRQRLQDLRKAAPDFVARQKKTFGQASYGWLHRRRLSFVFGCQRSGTKMVMRILDNSPETRIYHENHGTAFSDFQLRSKEVIRALVRLNPAPVQIFKPICDSQEADHILGRFPQARGVWVYRHYDDVANSARVKWGEHQREVVGAAVSGDFATMGWRTARIPEAVLGELRRVWRPDLTPAEGALLFWYLRNSFFFALGLDTHLRMRLVNYERLVTTPEQHFPPLFEHVGAAFDPAFIARVRPDSVGRAESPEASPEIRALCASLMARLDAWTPPESVPPAVGVLINTLGVGGAERYAVTVANWLAERGSAVTICATGGELVEELRPEVRFVPTDLYRIRGGGLVRAASAVRAAFVTPPSVVIANSLAVAGVSRVAFPRVPIVSVAHGWPDDRYRVVGKLLRVADRVVAVSPEVRDKLVVGGLAPARCIVVANGVDTSNLGRRTGVAREAAREAMGATEDEVIVVAAGRLTPQKAHHHVVSVAARLPRVRFAILGVGARFDELTAMVRASGVEDRVRMMGLRMDIPDLFGSADIYLSTSDWEGMPLATIEAMASGLPVVATRTEGSGQLLGEDAGIIVPVGDVPALAAAVERLAGDEALRKRLGEAGRARALERFGHERMMAELVRVLGSSA